VQKLKQDEENVRLTLEKPREIVESRDEIKHILLEQTKEEGQLQIKLA